MNNIIIAACEAVVFGGFGLWMINALESHFNKKIDKLTKENKDLKTIVLQLGSESNINNIELSGMKTNVDLYGFKIDALNNRYERLIEKMEAHEQGQEYIEDLVKEMSKSVSPEVLDKMVADCLDKMNAHEADEIKLNLDGKEFGTIVGGYLNKSEDVKHGTVY